MSSQEKLLGIVNDISQTKNQTQMNLNNLMEDLQFDSMEVLEFLMAIEKTFDKEIKIEELMRCKSLNDLLNLIDQND